MKKENQQKLSLKNMHFEFDAQLLANEVWLTTEEVMAYLKISKSTLYRLRKQHNIPNFKLGNMPIFPKHLLNKLFLIKALQNINL